MPNQWSEGWVKPNKVYQGGKSLSGKGKDMGEDPVMDVSMRVWETESQCSWSEGKGEQERDGLSS